MLSTLVFFTFYGLVIVGVLGAIYSFVKPKQFEEQDLQWWLHDAGTDWTDDSLTYAQRELARMRNYRRIGAVVGFFLALYLVQSWLLLGAATIAGSSVANTFAELRRKPFTDGPQSITATALARRSFSSYLPKRFIAGVAVALIALVAVPLWLRQYYAEHNLIFPDNAMFWLAPAFGMLAFTVISVKAIIGRRQAGTTRAIRTDDAFRSTAAIHALRCALPTLFCLLATQANQISRTVADIPFQTRVAVDELAHDDAWTHAVYAESVLNGITFVAGLLAVLSWLSWGDRSVHQVRRLRNETKKLTP